MLSHVHLLPQPWSSLPPCLLPSLMGDFFSNREPKSILLPLSGLGTECGQVPPYRQGQSVSDSFERMGGGINRVSYQTVR